MFCNYIKQNTQQFETDLNQIKKSMNNWQNHLKINF